MRKRLAILIALTLTAGTASAANLLVDPSFEDWTKVWTRAGTHAGSAHWDSRWIERADSHSGAVYMMAVKHNTMEPFDDSTPVDVSFFQRVGRLPAGECEASLY